MCPPVEVNAKTWLPTTFYPTLIHIITESRLLTPMLLSQISFSKCSISASFIILCREFYDWSSAAMLWWAVILFRYRPVYWINMRYLLSCELLLSNISLSTCCCLQTLSFTLIVDGSLVRTLNGKIISAIFRQELGHDLPACQWSYQDIRLVTQQVAQNFTTWPCLWR